MRLSEAAIRRQKAARAVERFNNLAPALRSYARKKTGQSNLQVKAGPQSRTDGKLIEILPPLELAEERSHNGMCSDREFGLSLCPSCASRENVIAVLHHEIGHIVHGSFGRWSLDQACRSMKSVGDTLDQQMYDRVYRSMCGFAPGSNESEDPTGKPLLYHVSAAQHPWLSLLMLVMEDARCDEARFRFDPSEQELFLAMNEDLMVNGVTGPDGSVTFYHQMPVDHQLAIGFLFTANGTDIQDYFSPEVVSVIKDNPEVKSLASDALNAVDTNASFDVALRALKFFNEQGHMLIDPGMTEAELNELIREINKMLKSILGHGLSISSGGDGDEVEGGGGGAGGLPGDGGNELGPGLRPEDIEDAIAAVELLGQVPVNVGAPVIYDGNKRGPSHTSGQYYSDQVLKSKERDLAPAITAARLAFSSNARVEHHRNQKSGRVAGKMLARRVPFGDERIFAKRVVPDRRSYHIVIGVDISGSTSGETLMEEKLAALAMADVCSRLGLSFEMWAHSSEGRSFTSDGRPSFYAVKRADEAWNEKTVTKFRELGSTGANLDGQTLRFYRRQAEKVQATDRIIMYYTDGAMPASNYDEELSILKSEIKHCKQNNITLMAVGMGVDSPKRHGFDTAVVDNESSYRKVVEHLGKRLAQ